MKKISRFFSRLIALLERFADRPWYFPAAGAIAAADLFAMIFPLEGLLISSVILQPRKWVHAFIWTATGSAVGSVALAFVAHHFGESALALFSEGALNSPSWIKTQGFIDRHGALAVGFIAFSPIPLQPAVVLSGLAHMPLPVVFISVLLSRGLKFGLYAWLATHAPHVLGKLGFVRRELDDIENERSEKGP
jgi:membrane protein YqaA with SNARE-associated domain